MRDHLPEDDIDLRAFPHEAFDDGDDLPAVGAFFITAVRLIAMLIVVAAAVWLLGQGIKLAAFQAANPDISAFGLGGAP